MIEIGHTLERNGVLLAGGNGFLGKVVLGLILDRYPELHSLHILLRPGQYQTACDRFYQEVLRSPALAPIVAKRGESFLREKVTVWSGDIAEPDCGLAADAIERLAGRVGVIVNCAGQVEFFPPVDESFKSNVDGVENFVALARRLKAKLVHVSTCYVCGEADGLIEETEPVLGFYPRRKGPEDKSFDHAEELCYVRERIRQIRASAANGEAAVGEAAAVSEPVRSREVSHRLTALGKQRAEYWGWVNTYTYAKSLGEQIIAAAGDVDSAIVRPAIIESSLRFPFPGWIEGGRTAAPLVLMALGGLKDWPIRKDAPLEVVPVDLVASAVLAVSALILNGRHRPVYQLGSADVNPLLLEKLVRLLDAESRKRKFLNASPPSKLGGIVPPGRVRFVSAREAREKRLRLQNRIGRTETLLAGMRRALEAARLPGPRSLTAWTSALRTRSLQAAFREKAIEQFLPFILHNRFIFESQNIRDAYSLLSEKDRALLPWDPERIDWKNYWADNQVKGIEKWVQPEAVKDWAFRI